MAQSLAREFGPQGVHVGHVIIDGVIDLETSKEYLKDAGPDAKIDPTTVSSNIRLRFILHQADEWTLDRGHVLVHAYTA